MSELLMLAERVEGLTAEDHTRLIGVRDGYVKAIVKLKRAIGDDHYYCGPIHSRHTRKLKAREERLRIPREVLGQLEAELAGIRDTLRALAEPRP